MNQPYIKNKIVIVTGASQGLGKELSIQLAALGAKLALISRTEKDLQQTKHTITNIGGIAEYFVCDVTDIDQVNKSILAIKNHYSTIDILVNGAGIWTTDEFEEKRPELIEQAFKVNSIGPIYCTKAVLPILKQKNSGHILNIISKAGTDTYENKDWPTYTATKWAVTGYTKAIKYSLQGTKIKVSAFYPGGFESNIFETAGEQDAHNQSWMMRTSDVANAVISMLNVSDDLYIKSLEISNI